MEDESVWFDGLLDRSCIQPTPSSFLKAFSRLNYNRPIKNDKDGKELALRGVAASVSVDEWLQKGIRLSGSKNKLGFLFLYELLTESIDIAMLATDKSYQLGYFLTRMLPLKNTQSKSATMSILRVLCSNPKLCPRFPKFEKKRSWFMVQGQISEFLKMAQKFVADSDAKGEVFWSRKSPVRYFLFFTPHTHTCTLTKTIPQVPAPQLTTNISSWKSNERSRRGFFLPKLSDFNRKEVTVSSSGDDLTSDKIKVFSKDPLRAIRERYCTFKSRSQRGLENVCEDMPFDMTHHKSAKSSIAMDLLKRVANDVRTFARAANQSEEAGIKGFSSKQCESMAHSAQDRTSAANTVKSILKELRSQLKQDRVSASKEIERCVRAANRVRNKDPFMLDRMGGQEIIVRFELVLQSLLSLNGETFLNHVNPSLDRDVTVLSAMSAMLHTSRVSQIKRCIAAALDLLRELEDTSKVEDTEAKQKSLMLKSSRLASSISSKRHFVSKAGVFDPRYLVFEFSYVFMSLFYSFFLSLFFLLCLS